MKFELADTLIKAALSEDMGQAPEPHIRPSLVSSRKKMSTSLKARKSTIGSQFKTPSEPIDINKKKVPNTSSGFKETPPIVTPTNNTKEPDPPDIQAMKNPR